MSHPDGPDPAAFQRRAEPFYEFRQIPRMLIDHLRLGDSTTTAGYSQDTPFIPYDTAIFSEKTY
jgi:hypothetical protein